MRKFIHTFLIATVLTILATHHVGKVTVSITGVRGVWFQTFALNPHRNVWQWAAWSGAGDGNDWAIGVWFIETNDPDLCRGCNLAVAKQNGRIVFQRLED